MMDGEEDLWSWGGLWDDVKGDAKKAGDWVESHGKEALNDAEKLGKKAYHWVKNHT